MPGLDKPLQNLESNLNKVDELANLGAEVSEFAVQLLEGVAGDYKELPGFLPYKEKLNTAIEILKNIKDHTSLIEKYEIVYAQSLVLVVSNFESFLNEMAINLFDNYPHMVAWPEKKMSLDLGIFQYASPTVGEIILRSLKEKYNFQDLKSSKDFFRDYIAMELWLEKILEEKIILYQAQRHLIIHNLAKVDDKYLRQIRNTRYKDQYSEGALITVKEESYRDARSCFLSFAKIISENIIDKATPF